MLKNKRLSIIIIDCIFFISYWITGNHSKLGLKKILSQQNLLLNFNSTVDGYTSLLGYSVIYVIVFLFSLYNFYYKESPISLVRGKSRDILYKVRIKQIVLLSSSFSLMNLTINTILMMFVFNGIYLIKNYFIMYSFLQLGVVTLFYIQVGIVFYIIYDILRIFGSAILLCFFCYGGLFFLQKIGVIQLWTPINGLTLLYEMIDKNVSTFGIVGVYFKELMFLIIIHAIGDRVYSRKDFIRCEK